VQGTAVDRKPRLLMNRKMARRNLLTGMNCRVPIRQYCQPIRHQTLIRIEHRNSAGFSLIALTEMPDSLLGYSEHQDEGCIRRQKTDKVTL